MKTRIVIYITIIAVSVLIGLSFLLVYYGEDFSEEIDINSVIRYDDLSISTSVDKRTNETLVNRMGAEIGTLSVENDGYFTRNYKFPVLQGCIFFEEREEDGWTLSRNVQFEITYESFDAQQIPVGKGSYKLEGYHDGGDVKKIESGGKGDYRIKAENSWQRIPLSVYQTEPIEKIAIYDIAPDKANPLNDFFFFYDSYRYGRKDCVTQLKYEEPIKVINFVKS